MTYESVLLAQAELGIVSRSTTERKKMSTKTSFKRIALVAAASLGLGVLTSVAPASAAITAGSVTLSSSTVSVAVGSTANVTFTAANTGTLADGNNIQYEPAVTTRPSGSSMALDAPSASNAASAKVILKTGGEATVAGWALSTTNTNYRTDTCATAASCSNLADASGVRGTISITPDKPGAYVITLTANASAGTDGTATLTVYAGFSIDSSNPTRAFPTQGNNIATGWSTTANGVGTVRLTGYPNAAAVRHYVTVTGGSLVAATIANTSNGANAITKDGTTTYTVNLTNGSNLSGGVDFYVGTSTTKSDYVDIQVQASSAGNVTVKDVYYDAVTGAATTYATAVLSVGDAAVISAGTSTAILGATNTTPTSDDTVSADATVGTLRANVAITLKDQYSVAAYGKTITASVSGPGLINFSNSASGAAGVATTGELASNVNTASLYIFGNGVGGVSTITIKVGDVTIATKTVTFYGSAKTVSVKVMEPTIRVGTATAVLEVTAKDAAGQYATGTFSAKSSNPAAVATTSALSCTQVTSTNKASTYTDFTVGSYACSVTGVAKGAATLTINYDSTSTNTDATAAIRVTTSVAKSIVLSTDKATYAPGEKVKVKFTVLDEDGYAMGKGATGIDWLGGASYTSASMSAVKAAGTDLTDAAFNLSNGVASTEYYAPLAAGTFSVSVDLSSDSAIPSALRGTTLKATAAVSADTAVTALINSLITKINKLAALVAKIQKKLGVK